VLLTSRGTTFFLGVVAPAAVAATARISSVSATIRIAELRRSLKMSSSVAAPSGLLVPGVTRGVSASGAEQRPLFPRCQ
jgi:hypothetical protein